MIPIQNLQGFVFLLDKITVVYDLTRVYVVTGIEFNNSQNFLIVEDDNKNTIKIDPAFAILLNLIGRSSTIPNIVYG